MRSPSPARRALALGVLALACAAGSPARAGLIHDYEFNGTLGDSLGGPALTSLGGTLGPSGYTFGVNQGLSLSGALTGTQPSTYSIDISFQFDSLGGYQRLIDFKNLATDRGLYTLGTALNFFNITTGPAGAFAPGVFTRLVLTRDNASGLVVGYVNGVAQISFSDGGSDAVFDGPGNIIYFFRDDNSVSGEAAPGSVNQIRIYDTALSAAEVAALGGPKLAGAVPEPSTALLAATGLALAGLAARRRRSGFAREVC